MKTHIFRTSFGYQSQSGEWESGFSTYCGIRSETCSEDFAYNVERYITSVEEECTCKKCLVAYRKFIDW